METSITAAFMALIGVACGMLITIHVARYTHIVAAKHRFSAAFTDELTILKSGKIGDELDTNFLLDNAFAKHTNAYIEFWSILGCIGKWWIEKKWDIYQYGKCKQNPHVRFVYLIPYNGKNEPDMMKLAVKHIESLIS